MNIGFRQGLTLASGWRRCVGAALAPIRAPRRGVDDQLAGGSPVQSICSIAVSAIWPWRRELPVLAFTEDAAASGGYLIAWARRTSLRRPSSIVGSIGVVSSGFGFSRTDRPPRFERRLYTAGESKAILIRSAGKAEDVARLGACRRASSTPSRISCRPPGRQARRSHADELFSGAFWAARMRARRSDRRNPVICAASCASASATRCACAPVQARAGSSCPDDAPPPGAGGSLIVPTKPWPSWKNARYGRGWDCEPPAPAVARHGNCRVSVVAG